MTVHVKRKVFTVEDYHRMIEAGVFAENNRFELLDGKIIEMAAVSSIHAACVARVNGLLVQRLGSRAIVWNQSPVILNDLSEPEPDIALLQPRDDFYANALPKPVEIFLIVEVSHTTLGFDRSRKSPHYAHAGIVEAWIIHLESGHVEVYRRPQPQGYAEVQTYRHGQQLAPVAFPDVTLDVDEILGTA